MPSEERTGEYSYNLNVNEIEQENKFLKQTLDMLRAELEKFKNNPLLVCTIRELQGKNAIIKLPNGNEFHVDVSQECSELKPGDTVLAEQKNLTILKKIEASKSFEADKFVIIEKPDILWESIGGLKEQENEIKEVIELPLMKPKLFEKIGIKPPKGILLHGPPGTGKTLLAKAVANSTKSTFIEIVASELVQKFIGEGAKLVKEIFTLAREKSPSIVFIDEIDALAATRVDIGTSGEREVQRTFMQLLAEIDGFKNLDNVKIIGCTNRKDILDPAIIRPGRLDRLIYVPLPGAEERVEIFDIHSKAMSLDSRIDKVNLCLQMDSFSGADIKAVCTEAGYFAIRKNKIKIYGEDFLKAVEKIKKSNSLEQGQANMFG